MENTFPIIAIVLHYANNRTIYEQYLILSRLCMPLRKTLKRQIYMERRYKI